MTPQRANWFPVLAALALAACPAPQAPAATLEQLISRENPALRPARARLAVGRDGHVYLCNGAVSGSFVLRLSRDGKDKFGKAVGSAAGNATANADGVVATANAHFAHAVTLLGKGLEPRAAVDAFLVDDKVGWDAPAHVEAGESGDFYGVDQHRDRVLRISPAGKLLREYPLPREPKGGDGVVQDFRVCEKVSLPIAGGRRGVGPALRPGSPAIRKGDSVGRS